MPLFSTQIAWNAVATRDRRYDREFVYAVSSTKVYCRPSCPSRRPDRNRVSFFLSPQEAEAAGYRSCLRCRPQLVNETGPIRFVEQARQILDDHATEPIRLKQLAHMVGCSPFHLQRAFVRLVGLSPKQYQDVRRMERFASALKRGNSVTSATYDAGFESASRAYEQAIEALGMTPSVFRQGGKGITIRYTTTTTAIGRMLLAATDRGLVAVTFGDRDASLVTDLKREYPHAVVRRDAHRMKQPLRMVLRCLTGQVVNQALPMDVPSTVFQQKVWAALQRIPRGSTSTYRDIAEMIGQPTAARAVARACATNRIAVAIPCHRVIRGDGALAGYRWGTARKRALLALERRRTHNSRQP